VAKKTRDKDNVAAILDNIISTIDGGTEIEGRSFENLEDIPSLSLDIPEIDEALEVGGIPYGCIVEIFGPPLSGKTWLAYVLAAKAQAAGRHVLWIDVEGGFNHIRASQVGIDVTAPTWHYKCTGSGEAILELISKATEKEVFGLIVTDSVAALIPRKEMDGEITDTEQPGIHAKMLSRGIRKIRNVINLKDVIVLFINQVRSTVGGYGPAEVTTGGNALRFYCSIRIRLQARTAKEYRILDGKDIIGNHTQVKLVKTRYGRPYVECDIPIYFIDHDRDYWLEFIARAKKAARIATHGRTLYYPDKQNPEIKTSDTIEFQDWMVENDKIRETLSICKSRDVEGELERIMQSIETARSLQDEDESAAIEAKVAAVPGPKDVVPDKDE